MLRVCCNLLFLGLQYSLASEAKKPPRNIATFASHELIMAAWQAPLPGAVFVFWDVAVVSVNAVPSSYFMRRA